MLEAFLQNFQDVSVVITQKTRVKGESTETQSEPINDSMLVMPITPKQLKALPEGSYSTEDKRFYVFGAPEYKEKDIIYHNEVPFRIKDILDRSDDGDFTIYYGKKEILKGSSS